MRYFTLAFLALSTFLEATPHDFTAFGPRVSRDYRFDMSVYLPADRLRLQEIQEQVAGLASYEKFLDYLAVRRPSLFENAVLIHESGSLQYADLEHPRVILFGDGLMLAFAEDPGTDERTVEVMAFDGKAFEFTELKFTDSGSSVETRPQNCQTCHGVYGKPLWDPYDFWPNAYGSAIARFKTDAEKKAYDGVRLNPAKKGIYKRIQWPLPPTNNNRGMDGIEAFTEYVTQLQMIAALQRWQQQSPSFAPIIPALLATLNQCAASETDEAAAQQLAKFFPESWKNSVITNFPAWHKKVQADRKRFIEYQKVRYQRIFPKGKPAFPIDHDRLAGETLTTAQFFFVLDLAGIPARDFTMSQGLNPFMLSVPSNFDMDLGTNFSLVASDLFQKLKPSFTPGGDGYSWTVFDCRKLQDESLLQLQNQKMTAPSAAKFQPAPTLLGECMSCHSIEASKNGIPEIPFDRTGAFRNYLKADNGQGLKKILERIEKSGAGQMPPYRQLNADEKALLRINLEEIAR